MATSLLILWLACENHVPSASGLASIYAIILQQQICPEQEAHHHRFCLQTNLPYDFWNTSQQEVTISAAIFP